MLRRIFNLIFKETSKFTKTWDKLNMTEEQKEDLKTHLTNNPESGSVIKEGGGIRKLRWVLNNNKGKSGGQRVIYVYYSVYETIYLLFNYPKSKKANITDEETKKLKILSEEIEKILKKAKAKEEEKKKNNIN
jgi:hypothetical protein